MKLDITLEEAFNVGHNEGVKETLKEVLNVCEFEDLRALRIYTKARLKSLEQAAKLPGRMKDVSYNPRNLSGLRADASTGRNEGDQ